MSEQRDNQKSKKPAAVKYAIAGVLALVAVFGLVLYFNSKPTEQENYTLGTAGLEALAVSNFRVAIAQSAVDGNGNIGSDSCYMLENIAKNADPDARWFSNCEYVNSGSSPDTASDKVLKISDGDYCATYTFDDAIEELKNYSFEEGECGNSRINIL
jgi:hypothetical protein